MSTAAVSLSTTDYVRANVGLNPLLLQVHNDAVRIVIADSKPARSNTVFHLLTAADAPMMFEYLDSNVWVLATSSKSTLIITESPLGNAPVITKTELEAGIEKGMGYALTIEINIPSGVQYYILKTPSNKVIKLKSRSISTGGGIRYEPFKNGTWTTGAEVTPQKIRNLNNGGSVSGMTLRNVTVTTEGESFDVVRTPASQGSSGNPVTYTAAGVERILSVDTEYLLKFANIDNNAVWCVYSLVWIEE